MFCCVLFRLGVLFLLFLLLFCCCFVVILFIFCCGFVLKIDNVVLRRTVHCKNKNLDWSADREITVLKLNG